MFKSHAINNIFLNNFSRTLDRKFINSPKNIIPCSYDPDHCHETIVLLLYLYTLINT